MSPSGRKDRGMSILAYISASGAVDLSLLKYFCRHFLSAGHANKCGICTASVGTLQVISSSETIHFTELCKFKLG
jgi:hypothetical protein